MKKSILIVACFFSLTTVVNAQETTPMQKTEKRAKSTVEQRAQKHVDAIGKEITLTEDQKPKIYTLALEKVKKVDEIRAKYTDPTNKTVKDDELKTVKKNFHQSVKALLTPEQIDKLKAVQKQKKAAGKESAIDTVD